MASEIQFSKHYLRELEEAVDDFAPGLAAGCGALCGRARRTNSRLMVLPRIGKREAEGRYSVPIGKSGYRMVYQVAGEVVRLIGLTNARRVGSG